MNAATISAQIIAGACDDDMSTLIDAVNMRQKQLRRIKAAEVRSKLENGSKVRLKGFRASSGLNGAEATVIRVKQTKCLIKLSDDHKGSKWGPGGEISIPMSCCDVLIADALGRTFV